METESRLAQGSTVEPCHNGQDGIGSLVVGFFAGMALVGLMWFVTTSPSRKTEAENAFLGHWEILGPDATAHLVVMKHAGFFLREEQQGVLLGTSFTPYFDSPAEIRLIGPSTESTAKLEGNSLLLTTSSGTKYTLERARGESPTINR